MNICSNFHAYICMLNIIFMLANFCPENCPGSQVMIPAFIPYRTGFYSFPLLGSLALYTHDYCTNRPFNFTAFPKYQMALLSGLFLWLIVYEGYSGGSYTYLLYAIVMNIACVDIPQRKYPGTFEQITSTSFHEIIKVLALNSGLFMFTI